jgi:hypothetical protein
MRKRVVTPGLFIALSLLAVLVLIAGACTSARAHSWYPHECCSDRDCWMTGTPDREPDPVFTRDGWLLSDGTLIPHNEARPSPDSRFHVCRRGGAAKGAVIRPKPAEACLWVPQGAS